VGAAKTIRPGSKFDREKTELELEKQYATLDIFRLARYPSTSRVFESVVYTSRYRSPTALDDELKEPIVSESNTPDPILYKDLDTPTLLLDLEVFEANLAKMAAFISQQETQLRPHAKTHKCPIIAQKQVEVGAIGVCCQKLGEAEVMGAHGIQDVLITNQIVGPLKIERLVNLARAIDVKVAVDSPGNVVALGRAAQAAGVVIGVVIEVDVGMKRCGVAPGSSTAELAQLVARTAGVQFRGLMGYEGHCVSLRDFERRKTETRKANQLLIESRDAVQAAGIEVGIVSAGGTGTYMFTAQHPGITEVEAGSYIFMDTSYREVLTDFQNSLTVLATVISRPAENRVILDCGTKTLAGDHGIPAIMGLPDAAQCKLSEEHSTWIFESAALELQVGDKVRVIPGHCCSTVNLHDVYHVIQRDHIVDTWPILAARKTQ
jgi:D-serine deaminase-like pyridoxal phosphate-dependent protein